MSTIEFETELRGDATLAVPPEVAERLPKSGRVTVVVMVPDDQEDDQWRRAAYEQFMNDDSPEDAILRYLSMKFGDIFICRFPFTSGALSKPRPALVLFDLGIDVVVCRITSAAHSDSMDVPIVEWAAAGLAKPSVTRLSRLVTAEKHFYMSI